MEHITSRDSITIKIPYKFMKNSGKLINKRSQGHMPGSVREHVTLGLQVVSLQPFTGTHLNSLTFFEKMIKLNCTHTPIIRDLPLFLKNLFVF